MEYQETELEMLNQEISRKDEPLARQRFQIEDLLAMNIELTKERDDAVSHIKDVLEPRNLRLNKELGKQSIKVSDLEYEVEQLREEIDGKDATMRRWDIRFDDLTEYYSERLDKLSAEKEKMVLELEKLKQEEAICELSGVKNDEIDRLKADLSHTMDHLEKYQGREQFMEVLRDMRSNYDRCLAYMDGQEQIIDEKDKTIYEKDKTIDELRQRLKDKTIDELRQRLEAKALDELRHKLVGTGRKDHD